MPKLEIPTDLAEHIAKALGWKVALVNEVFEFEEDKDGYFIAQMKRKNALSTADFKTVCTLARDLGGDYVRGTGKFRIPGPYAKKPPAEPKPTPAEPKAGETSETTLDTEIVEGLKKSSEILGEFYPVIKDETGTTLSGRHREAAGWKTFSTVNLTDIAKKLELNPEDPANKALCQILVIIHSNWQRKPSREETQKNLLELAQILEIKGVPKERICAKISELVPYTEQWIRELLPDQYKMPTKSETTFASAMPREEPKFVPCAVCGVAVSDPVHVAGKFYCDKHAPTQQATTIEAHTKEVKFEPESSTAYPPLPNEPTTAGPPAEVKLPACKPEPLLTGFEVECPECHRKLLINHIQHPDGKTEHKVELQ